MPILNYSFGPDGPILDVAVGVNQIRANAYQFAKTPAPPPVRLRLLIDTGASGTLVEAGLLVSLNLPISGQTIVRTPSTGMTPVQFPRYDVSLTLLHPVLPYTINTVSIVECPPFGSGVQGLLDRDLLEHCLFVYNGHLGTFSIAF